MTPLQEPAIATVATSDHGDAAGPRVVPTPVAFPGRWLGGGVGALASLLVGIALWALSTVVGPNDLGWAPIVAFLGIPVAFVVGRHLAPMASRDGWQSAVAAAVTFALLAPPLGDLEIVGAAALAPWAFAPTTGPLEALAGGILIGGIGLVVSYVATPVTGAVAVVWILLMQLLPAELPSRAEMPASGARFGVRHVVLLAMIGIVAVWTAWTVARPAGASPWL